MENVLNRTRTSLTQSDKFSLRLAVALTLAAFISYTLHLENSYWAMMTAVLIISPFTGATINKAFLRTVGTLIGALIGLGLASLVENSLSLFLLVIFCVGFLGHYFTFTTTTPYAFSIGSVASFLVLSTIVFSSDLYFQVALWRTVEIMVGMISLTIASYLIFPKAAQKNVYTLVQQQMKQFIQLFDEVYLMDHQVLSTQVKEHMTNNLEQWAKVHDQLPLLAKESEVRFIDIEIVKKIIFEFQKLSELLNADVMRGVAESIDHAETVLDRPVASIFSEIKQQLNKFAQTLSVSPQDLERAGALQDKVTELDAVYTGLRMSETFKAHHVETISKINLLISSLKFYTRHLVALNETSLMKPSGFDIRSQAQRRFFIFKTDKTTLQESFKAGLSILLCFLIWLPIGFFNITQGFVSVMLLSIAIYSYDLGANAKKRMLGCLLGGAIAILIIYSIQLNIYVELFILFTFGYAFAKITFGSQKYSYIGTQANAAFVMALGQSGIIFTIGPAFQRLSGILLGLIVLWFVHYVFMPRHPPDIIKQELPETKRQLWNCLQQQMSCKVKNQETLINELDERINRFACLINTIRINKGDQDKNLLKYKTDYLQCRHFQALIHYGHERIDPETVKNTAEILEIDLQKIISLAKQIIILLSEKKDQVENIKQELQNELANSFYKARHSEKRLTITRADLSKLQNFLHFIKMVVE